jgi:hypothetical protein
MGTSFNTIPGTLKAQKFTSSYEPISTWVECRWSDCQQSILYIQNNHKKDLHLHMSLENLYQRLHALREHHLWVRTKGKVNRYDLFSLYSDALRFKTVTDQKISLHEPVEISWLSSRGPFQLKSIGECFNFGVYDDMAKWLVFNNLIAPRDFRLRLKVKLLGEYTNGYKQNTLVHLKQLSHEGLLLSMPFGQTLDSYPIRFLMNPKALDLWLDSDQRGNAPSLFTLNKDYYLKLDPHEMIGQKSFNDHAKQEQLYFIPLKKIHAGNPYFYQFCLELIHLSKNRYHSSLDLKAS